MRDAGFAGVLLVVLLIINLFLSPTRFHPDAWRSLICLAAPLVGTALASAPVILGGRGGIDISVGPLMGFVNAIIIQGLFLSAGFRISAWLPAGRGPGLLIGAFNGYLARKLDIHPPRNEEH